tara:strand:+ start:392 stop:934 length:543 start_codon:yes stop_codon:yes gene_type:complete
MYFDSFPIIQYGSSDGTVKNVTNLLKRIAVRSKLKTNVSFFDTYDVKNGETPEIIADKLYDDPKLHWVVMLFNDVTDRYHDWPMSEQQFNTYVNEKYSNPDGIHHYEISQESGDTTQKIEVYDPELISSDTDAYTSATPITNREYEESEQDKKRKIRLLDPVFIDQFVDEFKILMKESIL